MEEIHPSGIETNMTIYMAYTYIYTYIYIYIYFLIDPSRSRTTRNGARIMIPLRTSKNHGSGNFLESGRAVPH